ncbi:MAG: hypothetical protein QJR08_03780 [Bacillota bacterium]|nr:hypothetical protein [Bacillota bacterium]
MRFEPTPVPQGRFNPGYLAGVLRRIATAVNAIGPENFPSPIDGSKLLRDGTLPGSALQAHSVGLDRLAVGEILVPILLVHPAATTTSTTPVNIGPYLRWRPGAWPAGGTWTFEAIAFSGNSAATATVALRTASAQLVAVQFTETSLTWRRSGPVAMPTTEQNVWITLQTSDASYAAAVMGARLVFTP